MEFSKRLKQYSDILDKKFDPKTINNKIIYKDIYTLYVYEKFIEKQNYYEVFISVDDTKNVAGNLLTKRFKSKFFAHIY